MLLQATRARNKGKGKGKGGPPVPQDCIRASGRSENLDSDVPKVTMFVRNLVASDKWLQPLTSKKQAGLGSSIAVDEVKKKACPTHDSTAGSPQQAPSIFA